VVDSRTKKWQIQISRRLNHPDGRFAGVIVVMMDPTYFVEDYDRLDVPPGGAVMLISRENGMSAARIDDQVIISDTIDFSVARAAAAAGGAAAQAPVRRHGAHLRLHRDAALPADGGGGQSDRIRAGAL
jgi:hypothetical protein